MLKRRYPMAFAEAKLIQCGLGERERRDVLAIPVKVARLTLGERYTKPIKEAISAGQTPGQIMANLKVPVSFHDPFYRYCSHLQAMQSAA